MRLLGPILLVGSVAVFAVACSVADIPSGTGGESEVKSTKGKVTGESCASNKLEKQDTSQLAACACKSGGKAHCLDGAKVPGAVASQLDVCDKGVCVPDTILAGKAPTACKASNGDGRCVSMCVPIVAKYGDALDRATCASDERCVPCVSPLDNEETGVCDIGKEAPASCNAPPVKVGKTPTGEALTCPFTGTPMDVSKFFVCPSGGRCVPAAQLEAADPTKAKQLEARTTPCDGGFCVPEEYVKEYGQHKPMACTAFAGIEGRCFSTVFKDVAAEADLLRTDVCAATERCLPCFNPADGKPTGACETVSCDHASTSAAPALPQCCGNKGKCVPRSDIPNQFQSRLDGDGCGGNLCVPNENLDINQQPVACQADTGAGVCVSNCIQFDFFESLVLDRGSCPSEHTCVPCVDPNTGQPSGAPGCK